ncbi:hypothetical protein GCM10015536_71470 [Streptomyces griseomycini]|nr:hypothetical protein GCM10015536_71470 [Streptomyces griseomycini]
MVGLMVGPTTVLTAPTMPPTVAVPVSRTTAQSRLRTAGHPIAQTSVQWEWGPAQSACASDCAQRDAQVRGEAAQPAESAQPTFPTDS